MLIETHEPSWSTDTFFCPEVSPSGGCLDVGVDAAEDDDMVFCDSASWMACNAASHRIMRSGRSSESWNIHNLTNVSVKGLDEQIVH